MIVGAATVFAVRDMTTALAFYRDGLGFKVSFEWGSPTCYAGLCCDDVDLHLISGAAHAPGQGAICLFVGDVDSLHAGWAARDIVLPQAPAGRGYGMREFMLADPDGNEISAGRAVAG